MSWAHLLGAGCGADLKELVRPEAIGLCWGGGWEGDGKGQAIQEEGATAAKHLVGGGLAEGCRQTLGPSWAELVGSFLPPIANGCVFANSSFSSFPSLVCLPLGC